jgi:2-C-methyl-D-erythritol 4-phosphate cytidylyltransferase
MTTHAIGLVHRPDGTPSADRSWARALVVRHARDTRLRLLDILELDDSPARTADVLHPLADLAATSTASILITDGVRPALAERLARDLGLRHEPVPPRRRPPSLD